MQNALFNINWEGDLLKETKDILDELYILMRIKSQQQVVAELFVKHIKDTLRSRIPHTADISHLAIALGEQSPGDSMSSRDRRSEAFLKTLERADSLLNGIKTRIAELNNLEASAKNTSAAVSDMSAKLSNHY